jgi:hypothetical protein
MSSAFPICLLVQFPEARGRIEVELAVFDQPVKHRSHLRENISDGGSRKVFCLLLCASFFISLRVRLLIGLDPKTG